MIIGIDFGGVLSIHDSKRSSLEIGDHINTVIDMPNAMEVLTKLKEAGHTLYLISFCGKNRAIETKESLKEFSDIFEDQFYTKNREYKGFICNYLECDVMIDDRQDVLDSVNKDSFSTKTILFKDNWLEILDILTNYSPKKYKGNNINNINKYCYKI